MTPMSNAVMGRIDAAATAMSEVLAFVRLGAPYGDLETKMAHALAGLRALQSNGPPQPIGATLRELWDTLGGARRQYGEVGSRDKDVTAWNDMIDRSLLALARLPSIADEPDMLAICEVLGFDPTNHHNAAKCPYCRPTFTSTEPPAAQAASEPRAPVRPMRWRPMHDVPEKTGRYLVKHRGQVGGDAFYTAKVGETHYPVGWAQMPKFGPTHWLDEGSFGELPSGRAVADQWRIDNLPAAVPTATKPSAHE